MNNSTGVIKVHHGIKWSWGIINKRIFFLMDEVVIFFFLHWINEILMLSLLVNFPHLKKSQHFQCTKIPYYYLTLVSACEPTFTPHEYCDYFLHTNKVCVQNCLVFRVNQSTAPLVPALHPPVWSSSLDLIFQWSQQSVLGLRKPR